MSDQPRPSPLDRRAFLFRGVGLLGGVGLVGGVGSAVLAACGSDGGDEGTAGSGGPTGAATGGSALLQLFPPTANYARAGSPQRLTFGLGTAAGAPRDDLPEELAFDIRFDGAPGATAPVREVVERGVVATLHGEGLPRGYYPVRFTPDRQGIWSVRTTVDGEELTASFSVGPEGGPGVVEIGQPFPAIETATAADPKDVEPLCTRGEQCPFHDESVHEALGAGQPVVVSVSTPLYCQVEICGPVLDLLVEEAEGRDGLRIVHLEPYQAPEPGDPLAGGTVPAMGELGLDYEPVLFLIGADGTVVERLDNVYDRTELAAALDALTA